MGVKGIFEEISLTKKAWDARKEANRKKEIARNKKEAELYASRARRSQAKASSKVKHKSAIKIRKPKRKGKGKNASLLDLW